MSESSIAKAYVQIVPSAEGIKGKLTSLFSGEAQSAGTSSGKTIGSSLVSGVKSAASAVGSAFVTVAKAGVAGLAAGTAGIAAFSKSALDASAPSITNYDLWQYSSSYTIPGCSGKFDVNILANSGSITSSKKYTVGWHQDGKGWWYADSATSYYKDCWAKINGKWYSFDKEGYMLSNTWQVEAGGDTYYLGADGDMQTNMIVGLGSDGKLQPIEPWYHLLSEVPAGYRKELDPLIEAGKLKGKSGEGESLVLDLPLSAIRVLIILNRA